MSFGFGFSLPAYTEYGGSFGAGSTLLLDFTSGNQTLDSRVTFTRTTTATRTNSSGLIESVAIDGPRFDYNPTTLAPNGLLIEEQRVNLALYSSQFDDATWADSSATSTTRTANQIIAPDGTLSADLILNTTATNRHTFQQSFTIASSSTVYSASVYAKRYVGSGTAPYFVFYIGNSFQGTDRAGLVIDTSTFEVVNTTFVNGLATLANYSVTPAGNSWYRVSITGSINTVAATTLRLCLGISNTNLNAPLSNSYAGDGLEGVYLWGAQLEAGAFPTSYIPTEASQVTRTADVAKMTGTNFSSWYNATEGTMFSEASTYDVSNARVGFGISDNTAPNRIQVGHGGGARLFISTGGVTQLTQNLASVTLFNNTASKIALAYELNNGNGALNGTIGTLDTSVTIPTVTQAQIGGLTSTLLPLNGHVCRLAYYNRRLADSELQALTS